MITRRNFVRTTLAAAAAAGVPWRRFVANAYGSPTTMGLSDPALQPKFVNNSPNALHPAFKYRPDRMARYSVAISTTKDHRTGLIDQGNGKLLRTPIIGYGDERGPSWPGRTFEVQAYGYGSNDRESTQVRWANELMGQKHPLPVDTSVHWCYSLYGQSSANGVDYRKFSIKKDGIPIVTHLHGGHSDFQFDGNPEFFYSPDGRVKGPQWNAVPGGFTNLFEYDNNVPAGTLWYHDHALGITRLKVSAGLAGFYFVRDEMDTGLPDNPLGLPAYPYELAYAIQDRMFTDRGELFYPAFPGDPFYDDFIDGEGVVLPPDGFPEGGPTALAEFFGDHMVVNGLIWPKEDVEPRSYRMRLLNGTDSRFMAIQFRAVPAGTGATESLGEIAGAPIPFVVIGSDQGLAAAGVPANVLVFEPGARYDIIFDFSDPALRGKRVIMTNIAGDDPFGGELPGPQVFAYTDRIMAFDVADVSPTVQDSWNAANFGGRARVQALYGSGPVSTRKVALFEGKDEFGRLQPLLGVVNGDTSTGDATATAYTWFQNETEKPTSGTREVWEIYNFTEDAHPIHLHLVNFETQGRNLISFDADEDHPQNVSEANGATGTVAAISNVSVGPAVVLGPADGYVETSRRDVVTALPGQMTKIAAKFDKPGRYVWHCHILSHEDHEMMRVFRVE
jgi:spore coat protein A